MKIARTVEKVVEVEEINDILCNKCGKSCQKGDPDFGKSPYGLIEGCVEGGYHSEALSDMTSYVFSLCEECLKVLFDACAIPPLVRSDGETLLYDPNWKENSKKRYESWKNDLCVETEPFTPPTPPGWHKNFDGQRFVYSEAPDDRMSPTISFWRLENEFHITICRNHGETPIDLAEVERIRAIFIPEIPLDPNHKDVEFMAAGEGHRHTRSLDEPLALVSFRKAL